VELFPSMVVTLIDQSSFISRLLYIFIGVNDVQVRIRSPQDDAFGPAATEQGDSVSQGNYSQ